MNLMASVVISVMVVIEGPWSLKFLEFVKARLYFCRISGIDECVLVFLRSLELLVFGIC
jgi:hypothetical protein